MRWPTIEGKTPWRRDAARYTSAKFEDLKWEKILPAFGDGSPEIAILRVDPKTQATQLLIRNPKKMVHQAWLPDDGLVFITVDGAWDINWVDGSSSAARKEIVCDECCRFWPEVTAKHVERIAGPSAEP